MRRLPEKPTNADSPPPAHTRRRATDGKPFTGVERRRNPGRLPEAPDPNGITVLTSWAVPCPRRRWEELTSANHNGVVINEVLRPDTWSLLLMDTSKNELYFQIATGKGSDALKDVRIKVGQGLAGWVAQSGEAVVVPDTSRDERFFAKVDEKTRTETRSIVAVPVRFREQCLGVIELINCVGPEGVFSQRDLALLEALADYAAIAIENARHVQQQRNLMS